MGIEVFFNSDGTGVTAAITVIDSNGNHVDPDSWPITNDPAIVLSSHPSAAKTVTKVDTGVYTAAWSSLSPALNNGDIVNIAIDGAISGVAWTTWRNFLQVMRLPASQSSVDTVDTVVDAIKVKTDQLTFTVANQVDANALTGGGGDDAATIYTYFTTGTNEDAFKADVSSLASQASVDGLNDISAADVYTHFTTGTNEDAFKADVSALASQTSVDNLNDLSSADVTAAVPTVGQTADAVWDELLTGASHNIATSAGRRLRELAEVGLYEGASVWIDTVNGAAGSADYENGTVNNPSNNIADATTIANSVGLSRFRIAPASSFTLASGYTGFTFLGDGQWTLALGGQALSDTMVVNADVSGTCTSTNQPMFDCCSIGTVTLPTCFIRNSRLSSAITLSGAGTYHFEGCMSAVAGTGSPSIDFGSAVGNTNVNFRHYSGGIEVLNMGQTGTDNMSLEGDGALTVNANCTGGTIALRGSFKVTDNSGGAVTIVKDDDTSTLEALPTAAQIRTEIDSNSTQLALLVDGQGYQLTILAGAISNPQTATELYTFTFNGTDYQAQYAGLNSSGSRGTTVLSKS